MVHQFPQVLLVVETSTISGLSPLIIESDNVNVDSDGSVSGSSVSTGSFGKIEKQH